MKIKYGKTNEEEISIENKDFSKWWKENFYPDFTTIINDIDIKVTFNETKEKFWLYATKKHSINDFDIIKEDLVWNNDVIKFINKLLNKENVK